MAEHPLKLFERCDPDLLEHVQQGGAFAFSEGALSEKKRRRSYLLDYFVFIHSYALHDKL